MMYYKNISSVYLGYDIIQYIDTNIRNNFESLFYVIQHVSSIWNITKVRDTEEYNTYSSVSLS